MAKKPDSRRPPAPRPAPAFRPTYEKPKVTKPAPPSSAATPAQQGMLQLTFARHANGYGIVAAVAFALDAFLLIPIALNGAAFFTLPGGYPDYILWLVPSAAGAFASVDAVRLKRHPYKRQYLSRHFVFSSLGMVLFFLVALMIFLLTRGIIPSWILPWIYPIAVAGVPFSIISMAMTWQGLSSRKAASILLALVTPLLMIFLAVGNYTIAPGVGTGATLGQLLFIIAFLTGALTIEFSGTILHLIASSTSVYQREILKADNTKTALLQQEYQKKKEALEYRERSLRGREAHLEALQQELDDQAAEVRTKITDVTQREVAVEKSTKELRELDRKVAAARAEIEAKVEEIRLREADVSSAKQETEKARQEITTREASFVSREQEIKRAAIEMQSQARALDAKLKSAEEREVRLAEQEKALGEKRTSLLKTAKDLELKESELRMKVEQLEATTSKQDTARVREMKDWESKILAKEKEVGSKEVELRTLENQLRERYENATRIEKQFQSQRKILEDREAEMVSREKAASDIEARLKDRSAEVERMAASIQETQGELQEKTKKYAELFKEAKLKEAAAGSSAGEMREKEVVLESREKKLTEMQSNLQAEIKRLNEENRKLLEKAKEVEEREAELNLQELGLEDRAREMRAAVSTPGMRDLDRDAQFEAWEHRLREREEEFKRQQYQKEKEFEMREQALKAHLTAPTTEAAAEEAVSVEKKAEKVKTGTPRLDDLLYGGIPFNSNLLVVGPAFVGKEVAILNFVAEGLKKGVPAIIVTTTKLPIDVAKDMAPILPTFVEYDQLGLVRWVDATSPVQGGRPIKEKNVWRVNGPTDFDAIFQILSQLDEEFKGKYPYFRLALLTLSSGITQTDERDALNFFQRLVNRLRQTKAVSLFALERGMHTDQTIEALEHMVDGALHFKSEKQKTLLQVAGLSEVQTREWVPYKFTNKAIIIGSFQLERIR
ncbi:MAG TPA: ATPase domain-containing protein [Thermoplasmata archaeon]|jgi:KaiC/GvpD/RAD55 family RecA-like ATPase